jgi:hypothetical protein
VSEQYRQEVPESQVPTKDAYVLLYRQRYDNLLAATSAAVGSSAAAATAAP